MIYGILEDHLGYLWMSTNRGIIKFHPQTHAISYFDINDGLQGNEFYQNAFAKDKKLSNIQGYVEDSGEGRWTVQQAIETGISAPVIGLSLFRRFQSREKDSFSDKVLAALRREFGGHSVVTSDQK